MTEELINDGGEGRKVKINMILIIIATFLLIIGVMCFAIKALSVEYVDNDGILHENFFLIIFGYLAILGSIVTYSIVEIKNIFKKKMK